jgi:phosphoribosylaminoimidazole (AIR) synthetase
MTAPADDAYAAAGVDVAQSDRAVDALVSVLSTIELGRPSASVLPSGHYASVLRVAPNLGIATTTDGVGSKIVVAEQADRLETVGIDCVAMNVNDLICVGAEPIALLEPTVIYVRAVLELLGSGLSVHGLAHITGGGLRNLLRLGGERVGFAIEEPLAVPAICALVARLADVPPAQMWDVFNMGCGFVALVPDAHAADAVALLERHHPGSARIGTVTGDGGRLSAPGL